MKFGYNTNGFAYHSLGDALDVIAECGYGGVAITLDHHHLNPLTATATETATIRTRLSDLGLIAVVETGARYLLDRWRKHEPSFVSPEGRDQRIDFTLRAIETAAAIGAGAVTILSGTLADEVSEQDALAWLTEACRSLSGRAQEQGVKLALEPEPGMFIERLDQYAALAEAVDHDNFYLTLDVGHLFCVETCSVGEALNRFGGRIATVHIEDIKSRQHSHLPFGEGDIDFRAVLQAFQQAGYSGLLNVELQRHGHAAPIIARESIDFLRDALSAATRPHPDPLPKGEGEQQQKPSPSGRGRPRQRAGEGSRTPPIPPDILDRCRAMRAEGTVAEKKLWLLLRDRQLGGAKFRRQHPVGHYIVDFYCEEAKLAIELDGDGHADEAQSEHDAARTAEIVATGIQELRFWNNEVLEETEAVLEVIWEAVAPLRDREGG